ncbi:alpha/beta fold hydrolase [Ideonella sp. BN130291]|uniref:alpha/beta fold hydrolase n=1 Tax=Ideonella sp. BN130291 TaxID=3112940 RepID=UPI002E26E1F7|nr:alpha/beta hydrolase [Ideonella sp. BN130291]
MSLPTYRSSSRRQRASWGVRVAGATAFLATCALVVRHQARKAEAAHPPRGRLLMVNGVRVHVVERGDADAPPLVLLHGNGAMAEELLLSGLVNRAAVRYRVLVFDRPGYGHSERPAGTTWDPPAQAALIHAALDQLGVRRPIVLGHSWGAMVAVAMALSRPMDVSALVLLAGYVHPSVRMDVPWMAAPALPLLGRLMRHTVSPLLSRLLWPAFTWRLFSPREVTEPFKSDYPVWMSLRPSQLQAAAAESALMVPSAIKLQRRYGELQLPVVLVAGEQDRMLSTRWQAEWLHKALPGSRLKVVPQAGHMVHHVATHEVMKAIDEAAEMAHGPKPASRRSTERNAAAAAGAQGEAARM